MELAIIRDPGKMEGGVGRGKNKMHSDPCLCSHLPRGRKARGAPGLSSTGWQQVPNTPAQAWLPTAQVQQERQNEERSKE